MAASFSIQSLWKHDALPLVQHLDQSETNMCEREPYKLRNETKQQLRLYLLFLHVDEPNNIPR